MSDIHFTKFTSYISFQCHSGRWWDRPVGWRVCTSTQRSSILRKTIRRLPLSIARRERQWRIQTLPYYWRFGNRVLVALFTLQLHLGCYHLYFLRPKNLFTLLLPSKLNSVAYFKQFIISLRENLTLFKQFIVSPRENLGLPVSESIFFKEID